MPTTNRPLSQGARPVAFTTLIGEHLDKILGSGVFKTSDTLRELLRFTVQETMAGRGGNLKEYVLGTAVLERGESFDPKADSIVRVQMRRLREHLSRYYATEGQHDSVVIEIPRGSYVPAFRTAARDGVTAVPAGLDERLIVGRQRELNDLRSAFESAAAGHGRLICVAGEPGIGKTTVVEVFLRELVTSGAGCYVARGRCSERLAGSEAYLPMLEALESLARSADESLNGVMTAVAPTWYAQIAPLTQVHAAGLTATKSQVASQQRLKRELVALLEELTRLQPVVIFLDDLHWADASTVDVLAYAMSRCASRRILIVAAYRPTELIAADHPFQRVRLELQGHGICRDIPIDFLTREDVDRYLGLQFPEHLFPAELSRRLHERTEGNPLFMADLVRFLRDRGVLAEHEGRWVIVGQLPEAERQLPQSVRSMVDKKISELDDADRRLLTAGSVQRGASSESEIVRAASGHEPEPGVSPARQARRGARDARRDLRVVHRGL
jgi:hypothetical protein